ncbi:LysM peptidoglycan-binding domain-containing protein [Streptacidiphilus fuscans]|uniref:LysM peptidoglycan-binding domain-containing protein n=1 Tax=Streptacidiphilus fuscans TaxID=2789292 RepID=A0A931B655_9ACTN|nr:transglycosylase family protein [Streptacidiphilus fuscans]MBF9071139.1 LysM peptidoglycan-binding domain-containing protein [Streptacidiphilus fuscans]
MGIVGRCLSATTAAVLCALPQSASGGTRVPATVWDRLAVCESNSRWHVNSGNGYYGGLQISLETWRESGGRRYASRPDLAGRIEQIATAERILAWQGWDAWPNCARSLGLTGHRPPGGGRPPVTTPPPVSKPPVTTPPVATPPPVTTPPVTTPPTGTVPATYTVRAGDSLASIASHFHLPGGWPALYARNRAVIGPDPNALNAGTVLRLLPATG